MTSKLNIFNSLPNAASDDEDTGHSNKTSQPGTQAKKDKVRNRGKRPEGGASDPKQGATVADAKDPHKRDHQLKQISKDLDHPHTLDRKSGTGEPAFAKHDKKGGAGRFNKGTFKDDLRGTKEGEREEGSHEEESPKEEEDRTVTWDDYLSKNTSEAKQQVNDTKLKITDDQLKKELGKATLLQSRKEVKIDEHAETRKKDKNAPVVGMNTEHADLLGFRTGFRIYDDSKRRQGKPGDRQGDKPGDKPDDKPAEKEGETTQPADTQPVEKKQDEQASEEKKQEGGSPTGQRGEGYKGRRGGKGRGVYEDRSEKGGYKEGGNREGGNREGGYKGGDRGGYKGDSRGGYKGDNRGGYKGDNRGGYKGKGEKVTFNAEDESLFPKLG